MELSITTAAIATIISAATSATVTLYINRSNRMKYLDDQLDSLLKIALQYPYLENPDFIKTWNENKTSGKDEYLRYDLYCTLLFNFLARLSSHYKYNRKKIDNYVAAKDWIRLHKEYWLNPVNTFENVDSYDKQFKQLITDYLS
ncbi:hypothetical protein [Runella sp.]|uniref:hypothetical protein n=1 Tax=Runella sp. TaxID=1960881 RepID=UPI003D0E39B8